MSNRNVKSVVCFGEVLWDCLPRGIFLGGAPLNVAYHLSRHRLHAQMISAVGRDFMGDEAIRRIGDWGLDTKSIARRRSRPTGTVAVTLDALGIATFEILRHVAWDHVEHVAKSRLRELAPSAVVFGSLALREHGNRKALARIFKLAPDALRVADLNLRAPFDHGAGVTFALKHAQFLKLNEDELARFNPKANKTVLSLENGVRKIAERFEIGRVCVTAGARGAGLLWDGAWHWENSKPVVVRDTVGSGDAFLAALLSAILHHTFSAEHALMQACRLGEFVASRDGATPAYRISSDGEPLG